MDIEKKGEGEVGETKEGDRKDRLYKSAHSLGYIGTDYIHARDDVLMPFGRSLRLDPEEIKDSIKRGYWDGTNQAMEEERKEMERKGTVEFDPSMFIENGKVIPKLVADDIMTEVTFRTRRGDLEIFYYDAGNGIYNEDGDELIREEVTKRLGRSSTEHV